MDFFSSGMLRSPLSAGINHARRSNWFIIQESLPSCATLHSICCLMHLSEESLHVLWEKTVCLYSWDSEHKIFVSLVVESSHRALSLNQNQRGILMEIFNIYNSSNLINVISVKGNIVLWISILGHFCCFLFYNFSNMDALQERKCCNNINSFLVQKWCIVNRVNIAFTWITRTFVRFELFKLVKMISSKAFVPIICLSSSQIPPWALWWLTAVHLDCV